MVDIENSDELISWLKQRPFAATAALSSRAVLRVLPLAYLPSDEGAHSTYHSCFFPLLRATSVVWASAAFPSQLTKLLSHIGEAAERVQESGYTTTRSYPNLGRICAIAAKVAHSVLQYNKGKASTKLNSAEMPVAERLCWYEGAKVETENALSRAAKALISRGESFCADPDLRNQLRDAIQADAKWLEQSQRPENLLAQKLWPENPPNSIANLWTKTKSSLSADKQDWEVWTDWYDARLRGDPLVEKLEIARVTIPKETWQLNAADVNTKIKLLLEDYDQVNGIRLSKWEFIL